MTRRCWPHLLAVAALVVSGCSSGPRGPDDGADAGPHGDDLGSGGGDELAAGDAVSGGDENESSGDPANAGDAGGDVSPGDTLGGGDAGGGDAASAGDVGGGDTAGAAPCSDACWCGCAGDLCAPNDCWRSALYPPDWTPGMRSGDNFLHDFSYAGYHNGEVELPTNPPGDTFDVVVDFGADATGATDATAAMQAAIDAAETAGGGIVFVPAGLYRCDGLLEVTTSGVVIRGAGPTQSQIYFTEPNMYGLSSIHLHGSVSRGPDLLLAVDGENLANTVELVDASSLTVGDEVALGWVISDAFVAEHGMTGIWQAFNGMWKPIFRRTVVAIDLGADPDIVTLDIPLRYPAKTRDGASLRTESGYLSEVGVESIGLSNASSWDVAWDGIEHTHVLTLTAVRDSWVRQVHSFNSPNASGLAASHHLMSGGIQVVNAKRVTVSECDLRFATNLGGGGNGYLFHVSRSNEILFKENYAERGRHNLVQNWDFGTTGVVWLRNTSLDGCSIGTPLIPICTPGYGYSEFHHSLAMGNLIDSDYENHGWESGNRGTSSSGAGHCGTQNVFWNVSGGGLLRSKQYGYGYVIEPNDMTLDVINGGLMGGGTLPLDWVEDGDPGVPVYPPSLYEDQLRRRLGP